MQEKRTEITNAKVEIVANREVEVLDCLMGCDLGNICQRRSDKPVKNL
jgi:hypothetical protein